jgi:hypothetical protein
VKTWLRWLLLTFSIGGGFAGLVLSSQMLANPQFKQPSHIILISFFTALYGFVFVAGLLFADDPNRSTPLLIALCLQILSVSSPIFMCRFSAGLPVVINIIGGNTNATARIGGEWQFHLFPKLPWGFGINLCALTLLILLVKYRRRNLHDSLEPRKAALKAWFTKQLGKGSGNVL